MTTSVMTKVSINVEHQSSKASSTPAIAGSVVAAVVLLAVIFIVLICFCRRCGEQREKLPVKSNVRNEIDAVYG